MNSSKITKYSNICETSAFLDILNVYLQKYNDIFINKSKCVDTSEKFMILNNNKKFYLFITSKNNFNVFYFFPTKKNFGENKLLQNLLKPFFIEIDLLFTDTFLLEGYIYKDTFLISDILMKNNTVLLDNDYNSRHIIIVNIFFDKLEKMKDMNDYFTISIHPIQKEEDIILFYNNFEFKDELLCIETVQSCIKTNSFINVINEQTEKRISKTKLSDVYDVFNIDTNLHEGILYIKTIKISKYLFNLNNNICLNCKFNVYFKKWEPIF